MKDNGIQPSYFPVMQPYVLQEKQVLVLWCPAGGNRKYTAPTNLGTGFPTIYKAMADNGSSDPIFDTDLDFTYFLTTLPAHDVFGNEASNGAGRPAIEIIDNQIHYRVAQILEILISSMKREVLFEKMNLSNQSKNRSRYLDPLINLGWVEKEFPEEITNPNQTYKTTEAGKRILSLINKEK